MKRLMSLVFVLMLGVTMCAVAADQVKNNPVSTVVSATADTTKKVGTVTGDAVGKVSNVAEKATKGVTGVAGDAVQAVSDTTEEAVASK